MTESSDTGKFKWDGLVFDIVGELSQKLNFTYKLVEIGTNLNNDGEMKTLTMNESFVSKVIFIY